MAWRNPQETRACAVWSLQQALGERPEVRFYVWLAHRRCVIEIAAGGDDTGNDRFGKAKCQKEQECHPGECLDPR